MDGLQAAFARGWFGFSFTVKEFVSGSVLISEQVVSCMRERESEQGVARRGEFSKVYIFFVL